MEPHQIHNHFTWFQKELGAMDPNLQLLFDEIKSIDGNVADLKVLLTVRIDVVKANVSKHYGDLKQAAK